ncbi:hypothetical protein BY458DRAFT_420707, partial [Sporodiniella umbellata]
EDFKQAKKDIESMGGKVHRELHAAMKAVTFTAPEGRVSSLQNKDYTDFIEVDGT